jgi:hypothetical protein
MDFSSWLEGKKKTKKGKRKTKKKKSNQQIGERRAGWMDC